LEHREIFREFMTIVYDSKKRYLKRIDELFNLMDCNQNEKVTINEFFELIDIMERYPRVKF